MGRRYWVSHFQKYKAPPQSQEWQQAECVDVYMVAYYSCLLIEHSARSELKSCTLTCKTGRADQSVCSKVLALLRKNSSQASHFSKIFTPLSHLPDFFYSSESPGSCCSAFFPRVYNYQWEQWSVGALITTLEAELLEKWNLQVKISQCVYQFYQFSIAV